MAPASSQVRNPHHQVERCRSHGQQYRGFLVARSGAGARLAMAAIVVRDLRKTFRQRARPPGLRGALAALARPTYVEVEAVRGVSFAIEPGEMVAFIGPNGAGKSTTIKMLTGILYPTTGQATVLGLTPWRERTRLAFGVASVFGQRSQLSYHLPPRDS